LIGTPGVGAKAGAGDGTVTVIGQGSRLDVHGQMVLAGALDGIAGFNHAYARISSGGSLHVGTLHLCRSDSGIGTLVIESGASASIASDALVAQTSRTKAYMSLDDATMTIGGELRIGSANSFGGTITLANGATLNCAGTMTVENGRVILSKAGDHLLDIGGCSISSNGLIDVNDNAILVRGSQPLDEIESFIFTARNGGAWDGAGISSSAARDNPAHNTTLGAIRGDQFVDVHGPGATFHGRSVSPDDVLVQYTLYGDTDFNGVVNFDDYARIDAGFNNNRSGWFNGDFDLNGVINFDDYALIDLAFNTQGPALRAIPEPTSILALGGLAALAASGRRRHRRRVTFPPLQA
jgi:hypothetical protein